MKKITEKKLNEISQEVFAVVEKNLRDRRGIRQEWDNVDEEIQQEIRETNQENIKQVLKNLLDL